MTLGERIRFERLQRNWSQRKLALGVGVSQPTICGWELDEKAPNVKHIQSLAATLGLPVLYLLTGEGTLPRYDQGQLLMELRHYGMTDLLDSNKRTVWVLRDAEEVLVSALTLADPRIIDRIPALFFLQPEMSPPLLKGHARALKVERRLGWVCAVAEALVPSGVGFETPVLRGLDLEPDLEAPWDSLGVPTADRTNLPPFSKRWRIDYDQTLQGFEDVVTPLLGP